MGNAPNRIVTILVEAGNVDTVYRDVYLDRAWMLLAPLLSAEDLHRIEQEQAELAQLPLSIARALGRRQLGPRQGTESAGGDAEADRGKHEGAHRDQPRSLRRYGRQARSVFSWLGPIHRGDDEGLPALRTRAIGSSTHGTSDIASERRW
jgi:hypothetical protein